MTWAITIVFLAAYYSAAIYFVRGVQLTTKNICICGAIIAMMDAVKKSGDKINIEELSRELGCKIVGISALKGVGIQAAAEAAIGAAKEARPIPTHPFSGPVEHAVAHIEEAELNGVPPEQQRWYAVKIFERDEKVLAQLNIPKDTLKHMSA